MKNKLIIFTRYPEPGKVKTRLIPKLGADAAALVQAAMILHILDQARRLPDDYEIEIRYTGADELTMHNWLGDDLIYHDQGEGDLGQRLERAVSKSLESSLKIIIIGSDCPEIDTRLLLQAFDELEDNDLVIGPAYDGGYYLLGLKRSYPPLFREIPWGGEEVLNKTLDIAGNLNLKIHELEKLNDIDTPEDIKFYKRAVSGQGGRIPQVTVIIPALNEEKNIKNCLIHIPNNPEIQIIVADGGSTDETVNLAEIFQDILILKDIPGKRANQMNVAAIFAQGDALLFLHADTTLPFNFLKYVDLILANPWNVAGAFSLFIEGSRPGLMFIEKMANLRSRLFKMPYGDQAIFLKRSLFEKLGGFADVPIMEDFELISRLKKLGNIEISRARVRTSARRWSQLGIIKTTLINQFAVFAYFMGVDLNFIAKIYRREFLFRDIFRKERPFNTPASLTEEGKG